MNPQSFSFLSWIRDILLIFTICLIGTLFTGSLANHPKNNENILCFSGMSPTETSSNHSPAKPKKEEKFHVRTYHWRDRLNTECKTVFQIPDSTLKTEMHKFGGPPSMTHPMLLKKRGFRVESGQSYIMNMEVHEKSVAIVDYHKIFRQNLTIFPPLTQTLDQSAGNLGEQDRLPIFLMFIQQIPYKQPPAIYKGKYIGEFFIPLVCLYEQYGDCDSKSLLLAELLATTSPDTLSKEKMGIVLVRAQGLSHALLGIKRQYLPGMTVLFFAGKGYYIVVETTRPGWAPGFIDRRITEAIKSGYFEYVELI